MFFGGGGPTTEEIIQKEFEKQRKFIEEQFSKQQDFFKDLMTQTEVENVKAKALGVLDALQSRFEYISAYEDLESCLEENSVVEITQRVEYFMDQSDAEAVKHTFDSYCPKILSSGYSDSQRVCGFLLYTYLVIEEKRHEILTIMINLLANTENFEELNDGYLKVQEHQKVALTDWIRNTIGQTDTYCGLFVYQKGMWKDKESQLEYVNETLLTFAPELKDKTSECKKTDCFMQSYEIKDGNIDNAVNARDATNCHFQCIQKKQCNYWSFHNPSKKCFLKRSANKIVTDWNYQSGAKNCMDKDKLEKEANSNCLSQRHDWNYSGGEGVGKKSIPSGASKEAAGVFCQLECQKNPSCIFYIVYEKVLVFKSKVILKST